MPGPLVTHGKRFHREQGCPPRQLPLAFREQVYATKISAYAFV
jgi:hypothetical protein